MKIGLKQIYDKIEAVEIILRGNGKVGLCEQVRKQDDEIKDLEEKHEFRIKALETKPFKTKEWLLFAFVFIATFITVANFIIKVAK